MDPAQGQKVMMVLIAEQLFHVLHVTVVRASGLLGDDHMSQHKLIVRLRDNKTDFSLSINAQHIRGSQRPTITLCILWHKSNKQTNSFYMGAEQQLGVAKDLQGVAKLTLDWGLVIGMKQLQFEEKYPTVKISI